MSIPAINKQNIVLAALSGKSTVTQLSDTYGVSRKAIYSWINSYKNSPPSLNQQVFEPRYVRGGAHPRSIAHKAQGPIAKIIVKNPTWGARSISRQLATKGINLGYFGVNTVLKKIDAETPEKRQVFVNNFSGPGRLGTTIKYNIVKKNLEGGVGVSKLAQEAGVSRKTIYEWINKYQKASDAGIEGAKALGDSYRKGENHPRAVYPKIEQDVLNAVIQNPQLSAHSLSEKLATSSYTIWKILDNYNLGTYQDRLAYAKKFEPAMPVVPTPVPTDRVRSVWQQFVPSLAPAPPPATPSQARLAWRVGRPSSISFVKTSFISLILTFFISLGILTWIHLLTGVSSLQGAIGYIFSGLALATGMLFFLYSLKYYLTLAIVLSFSQSEQSEKLKANGKKGGFLASILGLGKGNGNGTSAPSALLGTSSLSVKNGYPGAVGLEPNLDHINLERYPFISIQIPFYNEKNVVERAIAASTGFDYKGEYEVILCDDSTDETSTIIKRYQQKFLAKGESLKVFGNPQEGWTLSAVEVAPGVTLKHLQRTSRSGFKGGALREALRHTDPRAEFVSVFDADFVPYPDTLTLFLKYFQATAGSLDFAKSKQSSVNSKPNKTANDELQITDYGQRIAAVQGYQWHVLNKSENWITRGIRSEYAGSYVIERSGEEIYGGLKQISGSVYMIRKDVLQEIGWENSITEDFELTLKLYNAGYKVVYTPYIQAPAECVSTIKRLIRQRMRWAEGHSQNVKKMFRKLIFNPKLTLSEKLEFLYLSPYYLQALFFLIGTFSWLISETVFRTHLPFWTELWGWSLVLTNLLALPLMNAVGLFLEESEEKDYAGIASFLALSYILVPFQAYASLKGFLERTEGPWFRTPKTGRITDIFTRGKFFRFIQGILPRQKSLGQLGGQAGRAPAVQDIGNRVQGIGYSALNPSAHTPNPNPYTLNPSFSIRPRRIKWASKATLAVLLVVVVFLNNLSFFANTTNAQAADPAIEQQINIIDQEYSTTSTSSAPTDNSLGYIYWDSAKYSGTRTINLDIVGRTSATSAQMIAALYDDSGGIVSQSKTTIGNANKIVTLDGCPECNSTGAILYTYIVLDGSGYPVITYSDSTVDNLKLIHCGNANCTSGNVVTTIDGSGCTPTGCSSSRGIQKHKGFVLNSSGYPVISYYNSTNADLMLVVCGNANCTSATYQTVDGCASSPCAYNEALGSYASMVLDGSGYPVITYFSEAVDDLMFVHCANADCSSGSNTYRRLDGCVDTGECPNGGGLGDGQVNNQSTGQYSSIKLDSNGYPVVSYRENGGDNTKLVHCGDANCTPSSAYFYVVDDGTGILDSSGIYTSLQLDSSGYPVISFGRGSFGNNLDLKFVHCNDVNCQGETGNTITLDGQGPSATLCAEGASGDCDSGDVGWYNRLVLSSGNPVISYRSHAAGDLKLILCNDANCASFNESVVRVDGCTGCDTDGSSSSTGAGGYTGLVLDSSGYPIISYKIVSGSEDLMVVHCGNADCNPTGSGQVDPTNNQRAESMVFTPNLTGGATTRNLTVRVWVTSGTGYIKAARLRIIQNDATNITDTQTQIELGDDQTITATTYGELTNPKYYYYDTAKFSGTETAYFEASLKGEGSQGNGRIWSSGYELGSITDDMEWWAWSTGTPSVQSTEKRSGTYALEANSGEYATHIFYNSAIKADVYVRAYVKITTTVSAVADIISLRTASNIRARIELNTDKTLDLIDGAGNVIGTSPALSSTTTYYRVEMHFDATPATTNTDILEAKLEGTSFASSSNRELLAIGRLRVGIDGASTVTAYFDDIALNNSTGGWPGPGRIVHLKASTPAGDNSSWTPLSGDNYTNVDEATPDDVTSYVSTATQNAIDDYNIDNSSSTNPVISTGDDVNVVQIGVRFANSAAGTETFQVRLKDSSGGTVDPGSTITSDSTTYETNVTTGDRLYSLISYDLPGSSTTKWTAGTLDSAQIGITKISATGSVSIRVSTVWAQVDFTPAAESTGVSAYARLEVCTNETSCSWAEVSGSEKFTTTSTFQRVRSGAITLTDTARYRVAVKRSSASGTIKIANAKLIIGQTAAGGLTDIELVHQYINSNTSETATSLTAKQFYNEFDDDNFVGGTFNYFYEATLYCTTGCTGTTDLYNGTSTISNSSTNTTSETPTRIPVQASRTALSGMPTTATNLDARLQATSGDTTYANTSWLIIQVSGLQVPENLLLFLPFVLFIPKILAKGGLKLPNFNPISFLPRQEDIKSIKRRKILWRRELLNR